jgi:4-amino-4-deoxy-L-arabinose transferase-like glycosyltransferase
MTWRLTRRQILLGVVLLLSLLLRLHFVSVPLERDEGEYAYVAWLMHDGGVPYRDAFNQKPPGVFFSYLLFMQLFGFTTEGIHLGMYAWTLGTIVFVYLTGSRVFSPAAGIIAAAVFSVASISPAFLGTAANTEILMALPLAAAAYCAAGFLVQSGTPLARCLLCGLLVGLATSMKQVGVTDGALFALVIVAATLHAGEAPKTLLWRAATFAAGVVLPWVPLLAFFAANGALGDLVGDALLHNLRYSRVVPLAEYANNFALTMKLSLLPYVWPYLLMAGLGFVAVAMRRQTECAAWWFVPGWLLASGVGTSIGGIFRQHYFLQMLAPVSLLAGYFLELSTRRITSRSIRFAVCGAAVALPLVLHVRPFFVYGPDQLSDALYPGNPFAESTRVAELVSRKTAPTDRVLIVGSEPQILFYARRRSASRYILTYPLMMDVEGAAARQVEMFAEAEAAQPPLIVVVNVWTSHLAGPWTSDYLFQHLGTLLDQHYARIYPADSGATADVPPLQVYERRPQPAAPPA